MTEPKQNSPAKGWLEAELADTLDEDYELEMSEPALSLEIAKIYKNSHPPSIDRMQYFRDLISLQSELIKLQSWVAYHKKKLVVIFEGRDSAGKGGVIKRITQRLNPRICRVVALPAPTEREKSQWYFQRYVPHLPAGGEIVLFDRSWYNRSGVERVMGFAGGSGRRILPRRAGVRAHAGPLGHHRGQILVLDHRRGAADALPDAHPRSDEAVEAVADGPAVARALGAATPRPRKRPSPAPTSRKRPGSSSKATTRSARG
jgi:hypothetical protein